MSERRKSRKGHVSRFCLNPWRGSFLACMPDRLYTSCPMKSLALLALCLLGVATLRADDPPTFPVGGLTFKRPADWAWVPVNSPMRKAQLKVPGAKPEESADVTFFY